MDKVENYTDAYLKETFAQAKVYFDRYPTNVLIKYRYNQLLAEMKRRGLYKDKED